MDVVLYASRQGIHLLVPACMQPSRDAERRYGPLDRCGEGQLETLRDDECRARIEADLDRCAYALVHRREADRIARPLAGARRFEANLEKPEYRRHLQGFFLMRRSLPRH